MEQPRERAARRHPDAVLRLPRRRRRGSSGIAGATTDIQHIVHQGMTHYGATFWVGANAVIRKRALDDIVEIEHEGGFEIRRYIQDRTVIEDTESSIDLAHPRLVAAQLPGAAELQRDPARTSARCASSAGAGPTAACSSCRSCGQLRRTRRERGRERPRSSEIAAAGQLPGLDLLGERRPGLSCWSTRSTAELLSPLVLLAALPYFVAMA